MIRRSQVEEGKKQALLLLQKAQILIDENELNTIDVADFGLQNYPQEGAQMITLLNTERVALKLICLLPGQTLPQGTNSPPSAAAYALPRHKALATRRKRRVRCLLYFQRCALCIGSVYRSECPANYEN